VTITDGPETSSFASALNENRTFHAEGTHEIVQVLTLDDADLFEASNAVVAQCKRFLLYTSTIPETAQTKWILFTSIDMTNGRGVRSCVPPRRPRPAGWMRHGQSVTAIERRSINVRVVA